MSERVEEKRKKKTDNNMHLSNFYNVGIHHSQCNYTTPSWSTTNNKFLALNYMLVCGFIIYHDSCDSPQASNCQNDRFLQADKSLDRLSKLTRHLELYVGPQRTLVWDGAMPWIIIHE